MSKEASKFGLNEYQVEAGEFAVFPPAYFNRVIHGGVVVAQQLNLIYPALGLAGETGEVLEKIKKIVRDKEGVVSEEDIVEITKELGDVLWYVATIAQCLNVKLGDVAKCNIDKLKSRKDRNKLNGSGDNR